MPEQINFFIFLTGLLTFLFVIRFFTIVFLIILLAVQRYLFHIFIVTLLCVNVIKWVLLYNIYDIFEHLYYIILIRLNVSLGLCDYNHVIVPAFLI